MEENEKVQGCDVASVGEVELALGKGAICRISRELSKKHGISVGACLTRPGGEVTVDMKFPQMIGNDKASSWGAARSEMSEVLLRHGMDIAYVESSGGPEETCMRYVVVRSKEPPPEYGGEPWMYSMLKMHKGELAARIRNELGKAMADRVDEIAAYVADDVAQDICETADAEKWNDSDLRLAIGRVLGKIVEVYY